jgi:hypothetical protein
MKFDALVCALVFANTTVVAADSLVCSEMVAVPAGAFTVGSNDGPDHERPAHPVKVARRARRALRRPQDRLHQPQHLGRIWHNLADLGARLRQHADLCVPCVRV